MEIRDFFRILGRNRFLVFAVFLVVLGIGIFAAYFRPARYEATATIIAQPANGRADFNSVDAVRFLLPSVVEEVGTDSFRQVVGNSLPLGMSLSGVSIKASVEQGTGILRLRAVSRRRDVVTSVSNTAANALINRAISPNLKLSILDPAHHASSASAPLRAPILASSFVLGLMLAIFFALIRDSFDRRLRSNEEIYERLGLEVLAEIPATRRFPVNPADVFSDPKNARVAEAYQRLVANLEVTLGSGNIRTIAVTSSATNEGKTTVTTCLGWALALLGHDVVVLDADLRKPNVHRRFGIDIGGGLTAASDGNIRMLERPTALASLTAVPAGQTSLHPAQAVNQYLPNVLAAFSDRLVLVDTPPALAAAEATLIAMMTKNVILVIDRTSRGSEEIERVLHELRRADVNVLGVVVNRAKVRAMGAAYDDYYVPFRTTAVQPRARPRRRERAARTRSRER